jgi:hypothetical protein
MKSLLFGVAAVGALFAVGAAQAEVRLVSLKHDAMHGSVPVFKYLSTSGLKVPVSDAATVSKGVATPIDGWAFIDQSNCVQIGTPAPFTVPTDDRHGTWSSAIESAQLGDGSCPGINFNFSSITFTWTGHGSSGMTDTKRMPAVSSGISKYYRLHYGLSRKSIIVDTVTITLQ